MHIEKGTPGGYYGCPECVDNNKDILEAFQKNRLDSEECIQVLEHVKSCDYCAEKLVSLNEEAEMPAPRYLKDQIIKRTQMPDVQAAVQIKKTSKSLQFLFYSLKTASAVAGALLILLAVTRMEYAGTFEKISITSEFTGRLSEGGNKAVDFINEFLNQIINGGMKE